MFGTKDIDSRRKVIHPFGALFASRNNLVVFGSIGDGIFVWNKSENNIISELNHGDSECCHQLSGSNLNAFIQDVLIQAVAVSTSVNHKTRSSACVQNLDEEGGMTCVLTGSKEGRLSWWIAPANLFESMRSASRTYPTLIVS